MKLQISFDMTDLDKALDIAATVAPYAHRFEVGTLLLHSAGIVAIERFKKMFPDKSLLADIKLVDRPKEIVTLLGQTGVDWITVLAGASRDTIHAASTAAHGHNIKIMLDLIDAISVGQSALDAQKLGVHALCIHRPYDTKETLTFLEKWDMIKGNTDLPIYISGNIKEDTFDDIITFKPYGIIVSGTVTKAENPAAYAQKLFQQCEKNI
ncbi:MAG TPA: orotidine 5'-phosphate decarboxylase / HUMPS family protein [Candidatus Bathyarchaeia archaeon]|nr:orotidine 5'-phosphate decarboxylase / HUMPS family protein [Candidatus Bathyarchaeia archaeon]